MKRQLTEEQDRLRLKGLRILARIIVRHRLNHPELYADVPSENGTGPDANGDTERGSRKNHRDKKMVVKRDKKK